jgi:hypothetical protein
MNHALTDRSDGRTVEMANRVCLLMECGLVADHLELAGGLCVDGRRNHAAVPIEKSAALRTNDGDATRQGASFISMGPEKRGSQPGFFRTQILS